VPANEQPVIRARSLTKKFGQFEAVRGIDVEVRPGESFGFLGPNGAGKSSTMRMIAGVSPVTSGTLEIFGLDPATHGSEIRNRGRYFDIPRAECVARAKELLDFVQLSDRSSGRVESLSGGMKRRLTIARGLMNRPEMFLLDEPTTGLDPQARHILWDRLYRLKQQGVTLVLTTHYMDEAEQLCDRLVVMDAGRIVAEGSPRDLITRYSTREVLELRFGAGRNAEYETRLGGIGDRLEVLADRILVYADDGDAALREVIARGLAPEGSLVRRSSLEDVFLRLTGRSLEE